MLLNSLTPKKASAPPVQAGEDGSPAALGGAKILLVEDEFLIGLDLSESLEAYGGGVVLATSLNEGFGKLTTEERIDVALLDVNLGGETVFPLALTLQERGVPLVFHSGHAELLPDLPRRFPGALWLSKPCSIEDIAAALASQLGGGEDA